MKRKKFNQLTTVEKYKRLKNTGNGLKVGKWLSILSPYIIIGAVNFNEYFTEYNGVKMSIGCILAMAVMGIAIANETKENKKINGLVVWAVAIALTYLMQSILNDLLLILSCGFLGQLIGAGFDIGANKEYEKAAIYHEAIIKAEAERQAKEELKNNEVNNE